ncbi:MAG: efflux RND transporter permease subunit, partial [Planctomycetota bacterium]
LGFIKQLSDIEKTVIKVNENVPVRIKDIAKVSLGPALRRGALDKGGAEAVGGVVVVRYGYNPLQAIKNVKDKITEIAPGLPKKTLPDGTVSQVTIEPFYDRTGLIYETLGTLETALTEEILVTIIVVIVLVMNLRSSVIISAMLPVAVLVCFIAMKVFRVDANIVALSGIAIAIGTIVDMGIVICENILNHLRDAGEEESRLEVVYRASSEVGGAVLTAVATTIVGFLPVFTMTGAEGKLFRPLAFTKTFALLASIIIALTILPPAAYLIFHKRKKRQTNPKAKKRWPRILNIIVIVFVGYSLTRHWLPLGPDKGTILNFTFIGILIGGLLLFFYFFQKFYAKILMWCLNHKIIFLCLPAVIVILGGIIWSGMGKEFMPSLDEGSFLYMPTTMPHASIGEALDVLQKQDAAFQSIPEIESVVGKIGRAETPLDPAPVSMVETVINYKPEYIIDQDGRRAQFEYDISKQEYVRDENGELIPDKNGRPYRQWRKHIKSPDDIWDEIIKAGQIPGTTSAPKLQPIAARLVMLQSGMRAPMGIKIKGPDLETIEKVGFELERFIKEVPGVEPSAVIADRIVGKPYLEIEIDRDAIARYGISIRKIQDVIEVAIGGKRITTTVEGRERYPVRVRYLRELRDDIESLGKILVPGSDGSQIPLVQLTNLKNLDEVYRAGPQAIKSEDTFLIGYVLFDKKAGFAEVDVVEECQQFLDEKIASGELIIPEGVSFVFAGTYENQIRAQKTLMIVVPLALFIIFMILYFQFKSITTSMLVFSGIIVAWAGGFLMIWLYGQGWFFNFDFFGVNLRQMFQMHPINLSVAIWVGFLALFGIASDDGVVMCTYIEQSFKKQTPNTTEEIRKAVLAAGS